MKIVAKLLTLFPDSGHLGYAARTSLARAISSNFAGLMRRHLPGARLLFWGPGGKSHSLKPHVARSSCVPVPCESVSPREAQENPRGFAS